MISINWVIGISVFLVYWIIIRILKSRNVFEKYNITAYGPLLMIRTEKGLKLLDRLAKRKRFWRIFSDSGVPAVFAGMIFMFLLIILTDIVLFTNPPPPSNLTNPKNALLIPGINDWIPLEWGIIGLLVTLVVHEFSHGILCRVEGVRVKSMGILLALVPIGGFAEPDEDEVMDKTRVKSSSRVRIFSAGVISNFIVAFVSFSLFFYLVGFLTPTVSVLGIYPNSPADGLVEPKSIIEEINGVRVSTPDDIEKALNSDEIRIKVREGDLIKEYTLPNLAGPKIVRVFEDYPAKKSGMMDGMVIYSVNGVRTPTINSFFNAMQKTKAGEKISVTVYDNETLKKFEFVLSKHPNSNSGFMGVSVEEQISGMRIAYSSVILDWLKSIPSKLTSPIGWFTMISMPINFRGFGESIFFIPTGFWSDKGDLLFIILNILYWVGWINFYVGLFNCLPAIPLDGGRVLHEILTSILSRRYGEKGEEISLKTGKFLAFIIFSSLALSIIIPNLQYFTK